MFVTVDGLDGSGKTTLVEALSAAAEKDGCNVIIAPFPGTTELGKGIRKFLLDPSRKRDVATETLLLLGNFREVYLEYSARSSGTLLIADRFFTSTLGYQGALSASARELVRAAVTLTFPAPIIDVRLILDVPFEVGQARLAQRKEKDRFDLVDRESFEKIRTEIMASASTDLPQAIVLDNTGALQETINRAWTAILEHPNYPGKRSC